jgi:hypothetical protein
MNRKILAAGAAAAILMTTGVTMGSSQAQADSSQVYVVHALDATGAGLGGTTVTVCLDGSPVDGLTSFSMGDAVGPVTLPAGDYNILVMVGADAACDPGTAVINQDVTVPAGSNNLSLVAFWSVELEGPALGAFSNPIECTEPGEGRAVARHVADAPPVNLVTGGNTVATGLANGAQAALDLPADTYPIDVVIPPSTTVASVDLPVVSAQVTIAYVAGNSPVLIGNGSSELTPVTAFTQILSAETCAPVTTTTTAAPTTTTAAPTPTTAPAPAPAARPMAAAATYTG